MSFPLIISQNILSSFFLLFLSNTRQFIIYINTQAVLTFLSIPQATTNNYISFHLRITSIWIMQWASRNIVSYHFVAWVNMFLSLSCFFIMKFLFEVIQMFSYTLGCWLYVIT